MGTSIEEIGLQPCVTGKLYSSPPHDCHNIKVYESCFNYYNMPEQGSDSVLSGRLLPPSIRLSEVQPGLTSIHDKYSLSQSSIKKQSSVEETANGTSTNGRPSAKMALEEAKWFIVWWLELAAFLFSFMCLATNVGILSALNGRELRNWTVANVEITPNTLISILATLSKSSLLLPVAEGISQLKWSYFQLKAQRIVDMQVFDDASRGPLGSLRLLWSINIRVSRLLVIREYWNAHGPRLH